MRSCLKYIFSETLVNQDANYLQNIVFNLINKYVPKKVFCISNFPQWKPGEHKVLKIKKKNYP